MIPDAASAARPLQHIANNPPYWVHWVRCLIRPDSQRCFERSSCCRRLQRARIPANHAAIAIRCQSDNSPRNWAEVAGLVSA